MSEIQPNEIKDSKLALWWGVGAGAFTADMADPFGQEPTANKPLWAEPAGAGLILGLAGAGCAVGYFRGRSSDRVETYIKIIPEQSLYETTAIRPPVV